MTANELNKLSYIINNDRTQSIYKYFLLLAVIDICKNHSELGDNVIDENGFKRIKFPTGIVIWKWLEYFYKFFSPDRHIVIQYRETNGRLQSSIRKSFEDLVDMYGFSNFDKLKRDILFGSIPDEYEKTVLSIVNELYDVITNHAMKNFGNSLYNGKYSVFNVISISSKSLQKNVKLDFGYIVDKYSSFSISESLYFSLKNILLYEIYNRTEVIKTCILFLIKCNDSTIFSSSIFSELIPLLLGENSDEHHELINNIVSQLAKSEENKTTSYSIQSEYDDGIASTSTSIDDIEEMDITTLRGISTLLALLIQDLKYLGFENQRANIVGPLMIFHSLPSSKIGYFAYVSSKELNRQLSDLCQDGTLVANNKYNAINKRTHVYYSLTKRNIDIYKGLFVGNEAIVKMMLRYAEGINTLLESQKNDPESIESNLGHSKEEIINLLSRFLFKMGIDQSVANLLVHMQYSKPIPTSLVSKLLGGVGNTKTIKILRELAKDGWITEADKLDGMNKAYVLQKPLQDIAIEYALNTSSEINNALNELKIIIDKIESVHPEYMNYNF